jgi:hypothetical protein
LLHPLLHGQSVLRQHQPSPAAAAPAKAVRSTIANSNVSQLEPALGADLDAHQPSTDDICQSNFNDLTPGTLNSAL